MSKNSSIFIGKLSRKVREEDLEDEFSKFGRIKDIDLHKERGFAFLEFAHYEDAREAVDEMHNRRFEGNRIVVEFKGDDRKKEKGRRGPDTRDICYNCGK